MTVASYVGALYEFEGGGIAQATFSFDSHLERTGIVEIAGETGSLVAPDPNQFEGEVELVRAEQAERRLRPRYRGPRHGALRAHWRHAAC